MAFYMRIPLTVTTTFPLINHCTNFCNRDQKPSLHRWVSAWPGTFLGFCSGFPWVSVPTTPPPSYYISLASLKEQQVEGPLPTPRVFLFRTFTLTQETKIYSKNPVNYVNGISKNKLQPHSEEKYYFYYSPSVSFNKSIYIVSLQIFQ